MPMPDGDVATIAGAIVTAAGVVGGLVARAVRWAARVHRSTVEDSREVIRDNTAALREFAQALGRMDGSVNAIARESSGVVAAADVADPPARELTTRAEDQAQRKFPRAASQPKR